MNASMISSAVSMQALQKRIDIIANNVANLNTTGYKRQEAAFADVLTSVRQQHEEYLLQGRKTPLGLTEDWGAMLTRMRLDMSQGSLVETGEALDLALQGQALFEISDVLRDEAGNVVLDDDGNPVLVRQWTRAGSFRLTPQPGDEENLYLTTQHGHIVRGINDEPISIPRGDRISIDLNGNIYAYHDTDPTAAPIPIGQLKIVRVIRPQMLVPVGENRFRINDAVDNVNEVVEVVDLNARGPETESIQVLQGFLEQSNVDLTQEMTDLIMTQRAMQFNARALASADTMMELTNRLRG
jgi:flagellar basal-body rod protein FlgG